MNFPGKLGETTSMLEITVRRAKERGHADHGWLDTWHTFSFASYHDPNQMGFRALRVINEDRVAPGRGFGEHPHRDMEILTYVLEGALEHRDSMGNGEVLRAGEFQRMSAGTGITHSEFNPSSKEPLHLYQIWLLPERKGITPSYQQKRFPESARRNRLGLVASREGLDDSLLIHQDASIFLGALSKGSEVRHGLASDRYAWLQILRGTVSLNGTELDTADGAALSGGGEIEILATTDSEVMLFDMA